MPDNESPHEILLPVIRNLGTQKLRMIRLKKSINGVSTEFGDAFRKLGPVPTVQRPTDYLQKNQVVLNWYPKIEAMKVIDRLEPVKRGIFSGSIGYIDFDGAFDLNIVIRTFIKKGEHLSFHVGGAIVAESDPAEEYQETLDKAHGLVAALEFARGA